MCLTPLVIFRGFAFQQRSDHKRQRLPPNVGVNADEVTDRGWNVNVGARECVLERYLNQGRKITYPLLFYAVTLSLQHQWEIKLSVCSLWQRK